MKRPEIPHFVHHALWAYDISGLDAERDARIIITQVLNRGGAKAVRWLRATYGDPVIAQAVQSPARGQWFPQVLNFWLTLFNLTIAPEVHQRALLRL